MFYVSFVCKDCCLSLFCYLHFEVIIYHCHAFFANILNYFPNRIFLSNLLDTTSCILRRCLWYYISLRIHVVILSVKVLAGNGPRAAWWPVGLGPSYVIDIVPGCTNWLAIVFYIDFVENTRHATLVIINWSQSLFKLVGLRIAIRTLPVCSSVIDFIKSVL